MTVKPDRKSEDFARKPRFRIYPDGDVQLVDARAREPVTFAHVADLHLPPRWPDVLPARYRPAMAWWDARFGRPHRVLPKLLDDIRARGVDFVFFGGDILDVYDRETAAFLVEMCRDRSLPAYYQIGNHDWEDAHIRYVTHECSAEARAAGSASLAADWKMPGLYYAFERKGVRFLVLDTPYVQIESGYAGVFDSEQTDWFVNQLEYNGPIVVFHHVPFNLPTLEHRIRAVLQGGSTCIAEDDNGRRVRSAIEECPNVLATFSAHVHFRSEDPFGSGWQFLSPPGHAGLWRYVKIAATVPPKSLRMPGEPTVEPEQENGTGNT